MENSCTHTIYFSAASTTRKIADAVAQGIARRDIQRTDLLLHPQTAPLTLTPDDIAIFAMPVYAGRIPTVAVDSLRQIRGANTPAIIVCVYGNRHYDDALLELRDVVEEQGFSVVSAGLFIAQHSIFPQVAAGRPDDNDLAEARQLGSQSREWLATHPDWATAPRIEVPGHYPYRPTMNPPLKPKTSRQCNRCGICTAQCPVGAIDKNDPRRIDKERCLSCAHCIAVCPRHAKHFGGLIYRLAARQFFKKFSAPQKNCCIFRTA